MTFAVSAYIESVVSYRISPKIPFNFFPMSENLTCSKYLSDELTRLCLSRVLILIGLAPLAAIMIAGRAALSITTKSHSDRHSKSMPRYEILSTRLKGDRLPLLEITKD